MENSNTVKKELYAATLSFIYYFCTLAAYYVMRPVRDQLAVEAGSQELLIFFTITFLGTLLFTPLFSLLVSRYPRYVVMPLLYVFFIGCQMAFIPFLNQPGWLSPKVLGAIFFVWVSLFNLFAVSIFWSFMSDIWSDEEARRLYPGIALGGAAGAVMGPLITRQFVASLGIGYLLFISIAFLALALGCVFLLERWARSYGIHHKEKNSEAAVGGGMWDGLKQVFNDPFIATVAVIMLLNDAIGTIAYVLITDYSGATFPHDPIAQTRFAASLDLASNVLQIAIQLTLTRWLLMRYGAGVPFGVSAAVIAGACLAMAYSQNPYAPVIFSMPLLAIVLIIMRSFYHGMIQPARETLYTLVTRSQRYKGKNAVDTTVWRAGDVLSLLAVDGFKAVGVTVAGFGALWAGFAALAGIIGWQIANEVEKGDFNSAE